MNTIFKRIIAISLMSILAMAATACTKEPPQEEKPMTLQEYVETFGVELIESFEESFTNGSDGMECKTEVAAEVNNLIINCSLVGVDNLTSDVHNNIKTAIANLEEPLKLEFAKIKGDVESLENVKFTLSEEDGDAIAELSIGMDS